MGRIGARIFRRSIIVLGAGGRRRRVRRGELLGPYYPAVAAGLFTLSDSDTGNRFKVASGLWTIDDADGTYVAYLPQRRTGLLHPNRFVLGEE